MVGDKDIKKWAHQAETHQGDALKAELDQLTPQEQLDVASKMATQSLQDHSANKSLPELVVYESADLNGQPILNHIATEGRVLSDPGSWVSGDSTVLAEPTPSEADRLKYQADRVNPIAIAEKYMQ